MKFAPTGRRFAVELFALFLVFMNILGFVLMVSDKKRARRGDWRIRERTLFLVAVFGGSLGSLLGMWLFHHKTKHWYFVLGMPLILLLQLAVGVLLARRFGYFGAV